MPRQHQLSRQVTGAAFFILSCNLKCSDIKEITKSTTLQDSPKDLPHENTNSTEENKILATVTTTQSPSSTKKPVVMREDKVYRPSEATDPESDGKNSDSYWSSTGNLYDNVSWKSITQCLIQEFYYKISPAGNPFYATSFRISITLCLLNKLKYIMSPPGSQLDVSCGIL